jgi:endonuclease YncB( thermonuclease family)
VSLLAGYWELSEDAAESTLIDLAARRYLEFRQPGNDPTQTTIHVTNPNPPGLASYERRILDRVSGLAVGGVVPLPALTFRDPGQAAAFEKRLRADVIADARAHGLSRRRLGPTLLAALTAAAVVAAVGVGVAVLIGARHTKDPLRAAGAGWLVTMVVLSGLAHRSHGERDTEAGRAVAARWLGVKAWLRNTAAFADLPPAAVAVWDRYLSYGCALGCTRVASAVIDLGMGNRKRVWSSFGGTWHRVRVRYPRLWPRYGKTAPRLMVKGFFAVGVGFLLLYYWAKGVAAALRERAVGQSGAAHLAGTVKNVGLLIAVVLLGYGLYVLVRTTLDLAAPRTVTGQVLWREVWRQTSGGEDRPPQPTLHYLAIDDGTADRTTAWALPSAEISRCADGDTVTVKVRPWSRRVVELSGVRPGTMPRVESADQDEQNTEALIAIAGGATPGAHLTGRAGGAPPRGLLTADDVGRAVGVPVTMRDAAGAGPIPVATARFNVPDGRLAVLVMVLSGLPAQLAIRSRRRMQPLPGIGDEAYTAPGSAIARRGDTVVALTVRTEVVTPDPRAVSWLLATAVARLDATVSPR